MNGGWDKSTLYHYFLRASKRIPWYKTAVRWAMAGALAFYVSPFGGFPLFNPVKAQNRIKPAETEIDPAQSMGGFSENEITLQNASFVEMPKEFSRTELLLYKFHKIEPGDTISDMAQKYGLNPDSIISVNGITNARTLPTGRILKIPNQDGILYQVKNGDTLQDVEKKFDTNKQSILMANELFSENLKPNTSIFIPGAKLDIVDLHEINGDLFAWPVRGRITSKYGYRADPFTQTRQFHSGLDIAVPKGTPIKAAMPGRVAFAGYDSTYGNYVVIQHHSGYRTLYGHMSVIRTKPGAYVETGERIGDAGSTGRSTGPHLHFTVYKNNRTVDPHPLIK